MEKTEQIRWSVVTLMCCGRASRLSESGTGCMFSSEPSDGTILPNFSEISSFSATSKQSLLPVSTFDRLLCCSVSSPPESRLISLFFLFFCVRCSNVLQRVPESLTRPAKQSAHALVPPGPTNCWVRCLSLWLHSGVHRGSSLLTPMFLCNCLIRAETQGLLRGSWPRQTSRSWMAVWGRSCWTRPMKVSRFCWKDVGKRHTRGWLEQVRKLAWDTGFSILKTCLTNASIHIFLHV